ncbi:MAG: hypothetical protein L0922_06230, partial [Candidatus Mariimomonas ferrooxydans]
HCGLTAILIQDRFSTSGNDIECSLTYERVTYYGVIMEITDLRKIGEHQRKEIPPLVYKSR